MYLGTVVGIYILKHEASVAGLYDSRFASLFPHSFQPIYCFGWICIYFSVSEVHINNAFWLSFVCRFVGQFFVSTKN